MFERIASKWRVFVYNFTWDDYATYLNGHITKAALVIPIFGYAVIFNDYVTDELTFENLTNEVQTTFFLDPDARLRLLFFASLILAAGNLSYRLMRPHAMKVGESLEDYSEYFLNHVPSPAFLRLHREIQSSDFDPYTTDGKYNHDDWELFWREAHWSQSGRNLLDEDTLLEDLYDYQRVDYEQAKRRHKSVLLSILRETYFRETRKRRPQLTFCILLATVGYALLIIPSLDLTLRVIELTFF
uniref:hypothetical protein n=1 Tax=Roseovarius indicus TaxID=540747 RepID=UPI003B51D8E0